MEREFVGNKIGEEFKSWAPGSVIVIQAPTGSGKTSFILHDLLPYAIAKKQQIVYLCNRRALRKQIKKDSKERISSLLCSSDSFQLMSYHQLSKMGKLLREEAYHYTGTPQSPKAKQKRAAMEALKNASYIILDEAHFFLADADFNMDMNLCIDYIKHIHDNNPYAIWVYMTATPEYLYLVLDSIYSRNDRNENVISRSFPYTNKIVFYDARSPEANLSYLLQYKEHTKQQLSSILEDKYRLTLESQLPFLYLHYKSFSDIPISQIEYGRYLTWTAFRYERPDLYWKFPSQFFNRLDFQRYSTINPSVWARIYQYKPDEYKIIDDLHKLFDQNESQHSAIIDPNYFQKKFDAYAKYFDKIQKDYKTYAIKPDYSYIEPVYYKDNIDLFQSIIHTPHDEKWIIFSKSISKGRSLHDKLTDAGIDSVFIDRKTPSETDTPGQKSHKKIINTSCFSERVLITTKVLDNGVNIHDPTVKHIVIQDINQTTFLQMIGRKRRTYQPNEKVYLYLQDLSEPQLKYTFVTHTFIYINFLSQLYKLSNHKFDAEDMRNNYVQMFLKNYSRNGRFIDKFGKYARSDNYKEEHFKREYLTEFVDFKLLCMYHPNPLLLIKLTYDTYQMLALMENAMNERNAIIREQYWSYVDYLYRLPDNHSDAWLYTALRFPAQTISEKAKEHIYTWYNEKDAALMEKQHIWIKQQLSWIGLYWENADDPLYPGNPDRWFYKTHATQEKAHSKLSAFLEDHRGKLEDSQKRELISLFREFIQSRRPIHPKANSKGQLRIINEVLEEYEFPFHIESKIKKLVNKDKGVDQTGAPIEECKTWWFIKENETK